MSEYLFVVGGGRVAFGTVTELDKQLDQFIGILRFYTTLKGGVGVECISFEFNIHYTGLQCFTKFIIKFERMIAINSKNVFKGPVYIG